MHWHVLCPIIVASQGLFADVDDATELLQVKFGVHQLDEDDVQSTQNRVAANVNLVSMETYLTELESRVPGDGSWGADEQTALETFKTALQDQFGQFLDDEHSYDQTSWNSRKSVHNVCVSHAGTVDDGGIAAASTLVTDTESKHEACRRSEKSWNDLKDLALLDTSCAEAADYSTVHEFSSQQQQLADAMYLATTQAQAYNILPTAGKNPCNQDQLNYEEHWCEWRDRRVSACAGFDSCIAQVDLAGLRSSFLIRSSNRRALWLTIQTMLCRIDHLLTTFGGDGSASDINTTDICEDTAIDPEKFVLALAIPPYTPCVGTGTGTGTEPDPTASTDWILQKYGWATATHVVPTTCQTACTPVTAGPTPHAGCAADPASCAVYNAHPEECGNYDLNLDVISSDCCACGPAPTTTPTPPPPDWAGCTDNGGGIMYRMDVTQIAGNHWCIEELSFYDAAGIRMSTVPERACAETWHSSGTQYDAAYAPGRAFNEVTDDDESYYCASTNTGYLQYQFPIGVGAIGCYKVERLNGHSNSHSPVDWTMYQSVDGGQSWTVFDERTGYETWFSGEVKSFGC